MFEKMDTQTTALNADEQVREDSGYQAPALRVAGSAVKLVQGHSFLSGYDWCQHGLYEC